MAMFLQKIGIIVAIFDAKIGIWLQYLATFANFGEFKYAQKKDIIPKENVFLNFYLSICSE